MRSQASFGIGTSLTNDFKSVSSGGKEKSRALNMVIKLHSVGYEPCVKISDELTKVGSTHYSTCTFHVFMHVFTVDGVFARLEYRFVPTALHADVEYFLYLLHGQWVSSVLCNASLACRCR